MAKKNTRPNLQARKSASKKAEEKKLAARKAYWEAHKKQIITYAAIALAAIIALALLIDYCYVPSHSVRDFMGNLIGVKDDALIREVDGRYYEFGTVSTPAGYAPADYGAAMTTDEKETYFYYTAEEEGKAVNSVYTIGVKNRGAAEMLDMVSGSFNYEVQTENKQATIGGHDVHYFYAQGLASEENPDIFIATMTCYVDSIKDSCVLVSLAYVEGALEELPSEEAMLADTEGIFAALTISK